MSAGSKRARNLRYRASKKLPYLMKKQQHHCFFCNKLIVMIRDIEIIKKNYLTVTWKLGEQIYQTHIATVEHLIPLHRGGTNVLGNIVASCAECNFERNKLFCVKKPCRICNEIFTNSGKKCQKCRKISSYEYNLMFLGRS